MVSLTGRAFIQSAAGITGVHSDSKKQSYPTPWKIRLTAQRFYNKLASPFYITSSPSGPCPSTCPFIHILLPLTLTVPYVSSVHLPGSPPRSYSQVGMLAQLVTPPGGESWPGVARGQLNRPWLSEAVLKSPPAAAWCKFPQRRAGKAQHSWDGREEGAGASLIYRGSATVCDWVTWFSRSLWGPSENGLQFPPGVWT